MSKKHILEIFKFADQGKDKEKVRPFEELNLIYKDQGLQFDEYGNPIYLPDNAGNKEELTP